MTECGRRKVSWICIKYITVFSNSDLISLHRLRRLAPQRLKTIFSKNVGKKKLYSVFEWYLTLLVIIKKQV